MKPFSTLSQLTLIAGLALAGLTAACTTEAPPPPDDDDEEPADPQGPSGSGGGGLGNSTGPGSGGSGGGGDVNEACAQGAAAFCTCIEAAGEPPCSQTDFENFYWYCDGGEDGGFLACFGSYVQDNQIACVDAMNGCEYLLPE